MVIVNSQTYETNHGEYCERFNSKKHKDVCATEIAYLLNEIVVFL